MRLMAFWYGVALLAYLTPPSVEAADDRSGASERLVVNRKYHFSVVRPVRWFVYEGADLPLFFNYSAEDAPPQGQLPPGGAHIFLLLCGRRSKDIGMPSIMTCAEREAAVNNGIAISFKYIQGPAQASRALLVTFDEPSLGRVGNTPLPSVRFVTAYWEYGGQPFGAELRYNKADPQGSHYERVLLDLVRTFKPSQ